MGGVAGDVRGGGMNQEQVAMLVCFPYNLPILDSCQVVFVDQSYPTLMGQPVGNEIAGNLRDVKDISKGESRHDAIRKYGSQVDSAGLGGVHWVSIS